MVSITANTIKGLPIRIKSDKSTTSQTGTAADPKPIVAPKRIKKIMTKKSRRGLTRAEIWILYCDDAIASPARNAPIASENPKKAATVEKRNAQAIAATNNNSGDEAAKLKTTFKSDLAQT